MKRKYNLSSLEFIVGQHHVMSPDFSIARDITKRAKYIPRGGKDSPVWPRAQINLAIKDAIKIHHENRKLYADVMSGRLQ